VTDVVTRHEGVPGKTKKRDQHRCYPHIWNGTETVSGSTRRRKWTQNIHLKLFHLTENFQRSTPQENKCMGTVLHNWKEMPPNFSTKHYDRKEDTLCQDYREI
jgi:hypothetical protein